MSAPDVSQLEARLARPAPRATFDDRELEGVPDPVRRHLSAMIALGTPLAVSARLEMRGHLKLGGRWLPFRAHEVLAPHSGFAWTGRVARIVSGSDHFVDGRGELDWKLLGLFTVAHAEGDDVARSAAARAGGEACWVPTALLPRFDVEWSATDDAHFTVRHHVNGTDVVVDWILDERGQLASLLFDRWGDPDDTGTWGLYPFGMDVTAHATFDGVTVPSAGRVGWFFGTDRWRDGEFFRYELTGLNLVH